MSDVSWLNLLWCLLPVVSVAIIFRLWQCNVNELIYGSARMFVQLISVGFVLVAIFDRPSPMLSIFIVILMLMIAAWISIRPVKQYRLFFIPSAVALAVSVTFHLFVTVVLILKLEIWFEPSVVIPLAGMYIANTMNALSLALERFLSEVKVGREACEAKVLAFKAALIPQINGLFAVGLVALPGMMTGQILSGVSPLIAVRYQIVIMTMILGSAGIACALLLYWLADKESKFFAR